LSGPILPTLANSSILEWVDFEFNYLARWTAIVGVRPVATPQYLYLLYNNLSNHDGDTDLDPLLSAPWGTAPRRLRQLQLHLEDNAISGFIPPNISILINLTYLNLSSLTICPDMLHMQRLERMYLSSNFLSGEISKSIGEIPHLILVDFFGNCLTGSGIKV
jgi:hypothetical protein